MPGETDGRHAAEKPNVIDHAYNEAQRLINLHTMDALTGRCLRCGIIGPCEEREKGMRVMMNRLWLPVRLPFASRPERFADVLQ